jgi:SAM-dependent methyltransferase
MRKEFYRYLKTINLSKRILEIGPLHAPLVGKDDGEHVYYVDIRSTEDVKEEYKNEDSIDKNKICDIDYVMQGSYTETFASVPKFDYVISSHVIEHIPRLIDFFLDISNIFTKTGLLYLLIPDHRRCFDAYRSPTSFAEAYYIHTQNIPFAPWRILDFYLEAAPKHSAGFIRENNLVSPEVALPARETFASAKKRYEALCSGDLPPQAHYSVFTPRSFLLLMYNMAGASLFPFKLRLFFPTPRDDLTFVAVLKTCPDMLRDANLQTIERGKIAKLMCEVE